MGRVELSPNLPCPCGSGKKYKRCCRPLHRGDAAESPEALMRSRYAAYAGGLAPYVLATTDPLGPQARSDRAAWERTVRAFCAFTAFEGLEILEAGVEGLEGWVCFRARTSQAGKDTTFVERSRFVSRGGRWLYHSGEMEER